MSNPITGAYLEAQDKPQKPIKEDASQKMGLEALMSAPQAFVTAAFDSAIQTPVNGLMQLFNPQEARALKVVESKREIVGSAEWFSQLGGSAVGSLGNYLLLSKCLNLGVQGIKLAGACQTSKFWRPVANGLSKLEQAKHLNSPYVAAASTGAFYGGILTPVDPKGEDMTIARLKNAGVGAASVVAMITPNTLRLRNNAITDGHGNRMHEALTLGVGGLVAGFTNIGVRSVLDGKGVEGRDANEILLSYSMLGLGYGAFRAWPRAAEKPMELKPEEAAEKLMSVKRHIDRPKRLTDSSANENRVKVDRETWQRAIKEVDQNILGEIRDSQLPLDTQLSLTKMHRKAFSDIVSNPANSRVPEPFMEHWQSMEKLIEAAVNQEKAIATQHYQRLVAKQPMNRWFKKPEQEAQSDASNLPATQEQINQASSKLPSIENSLNPEPQLPAPVTENSLNGLQDIQGVANVGLRSGFLGDRINTARAEMTNRKSTVAKRANVNTARRGQSDLAKTIKGRGQLPYTTFEDFGYTAEQLTRNQVLNNITAASKETAAGIGHPEELNKTRSPAWNNDQDDLPPPGI